MVRSNSETRRGRELFHLVEQIRAEEKYFHASRAELVRTLGNDGYCEVACEHETIEADGTTVFPVLRLNLAARRRDRCTASLKLHKIRVDGIDWLRVYDAPDGTRASGWHRHGWNRVIQTANIHVPLPDFDVGLRGINDFLLRICSEMRITLSQNDVGLFDNLLDS